jgi:hypothetical protein
MLWSFRIFLLLFVPFALAAVDHHLLRGALAAALGAAGAGF